MTYQTLDLGKRTLIRTVLDYEIVDVPFASRLGPLAQETSVSSRIPYPFKVLAVRTYGGATFGYAVRHYFLISKNDAGSTVDVPPDQNVYGRIDPYIYWVCGWGHYYRTVHVTVKERGMYLKVHFVNTDAIFTISSGAVIRIVRLPEEA